VGDVGGAYHSGGAGRTHDDPWHHRGMSKHLAPIIVVLAAAATLLACGEPDCPAKSGANACGYCKEDRATSSNPHAGMCTYCTGACGGDPCHPLCDGGGGGCDTSWVANCGKTLGGIQFVGQPHPKSCGACPGGTYDAGDDNVTAAVPTTSASATASSPGAPAAQGHATAGRVRPGQVRARPGGRRP